MTDHDAVARVLARLDPQVWLVTSAAGGERAGLIATFVNQASIVPELPRVVVGLAKQHHTWSVVQRSGAFVLHLLGEAQVEWVWRFGLRSGRDVDKWNGLEVVDTPTGCPRLPSAAAWLECRVEGSLDTGDRTIFLAEVLAGRLEGDVRPLTVGRLLELAPADKKQALKEALRRDAEVDAAAIRACRAGK